jgi:hypothetical protein
MQPANVKRQTPNFEARDLSVILARRSFSEGGAIGIRFLATQSNY